MKRILLSATVGIIALGVGWFYFPRHITMHALERSFTDQQLQDDSKVIVFGTFTKPHAYLENPTDDTSLQTDWTFVSQKVLKGSEEKTFLVTTPGGKLGGLSLTTEDGPEIRPGDRVVAYLHYYAEKRRYVLTSFSQGLLRFDGQKAKALVGAPVTVEDLQIKVQQLQATATQSTQ